MSIEIRDVEDVEDVETSSEKKTEEVEDYQIGRTKLDLPSGFLPYDFSDLYVRPLTLNEVEKIQPIIQGKVEPINLAQAITGCVTPINPSKLTYGDFWFVLAWLRINTYRNAPLRVNWTCPQCSFITETEVVLSDLKIVDLNPKYKEPTEIHLPSGKTIKLKLHRVGDEKLVHDYLSTMLNTQSWDESQELLPSLAASIMDGNSLHTKVEALREYSVEDISVIQEFQNIFEHGLPTEIHGECKGGAKCSYVTDKLQFNFQIDDTIPSYEYRGYLRDQLQLG